MKFFKFCTLGTHKESHTTRFEWVGTSWVVNDSQKGYKYFLLVLFCVLMVGCASRELRKAPKRKRKIIA